MYEGPSCAAFRHPMWGYMEETVIGEKTAVGTAISVEGLSKTYSTFDRRPGIVGALKDLFSRNYREVQAVSDISFSIGEGEIVGYIGANGAGKSTSIKMLTGILQPSGGDMRVLGYNPSINRREYTKVIGVVFGQRTQLWWDIAVQESFELLSRIYSVDRLTYSKTLAMLVGILEIGDLLATPVRKLSLGQRMRCDLAASLLHSPKVLFLDEPTIGLDAIAKDSIRKFLREINREMGVTILLTTHDLKEIEELCKRVIILDKGKVVFDGSLETIKGMSGLKRKVVLDVSGPVDLPSFVTSFGHSAEFHLEGTRRVVGLFDPKVVSTVTLVRELFQKFEVVDLTIDEPEIEEVVMNIYRSAR